MVGDLWLVVCDWGFVVVVVAVAVVVLVVVTIASMLHGTMRTNQSQTLYRPVWPLGSPHGFFVPSHPGAGQNN